MKCVITGNPEKGLGKAFAEHFESKGYEIEFIRSSDTDEDIAKKVMGCTVFVNNAYNKTGEQSKLLVALKDVVDKMIVIGSMASIFPDAKEFEYSNHKKILQNIFYNKCSMIGNKHQLMLSITGSAHKNPDLLMRCVDFWLENPQVIEMKFGVENS